MDPYSFPPFAAVLNGADAAVTWTAGRLDGILPHGLAVIAAIALATIAVRALLVPVGLANAKAQVARARLAPKLRALQRRHGKDRATLARTTQELYAAEGMSPFAGMLPTLAQIPVVSVVYGVFTRATIAGHANALLATTVFGSPLGTSFAQLLVTGAVAQFALPLALLVLIAGVAVASRQLALRAARAADAGAPQPTGVARALSWLPLLSVLFAALAPMGASVYLAVSMAWTSAERTLAQRHYLAAA